MPQGASIENRSGAAPCRSRCSLALSRRSRFIAYFQMQQAIIAFMQRLHHLRRPLRGAVYRSHDPSSSVIPVMSSSTPCPRPYDTSHEQ